MSITEVDDGVREKGLIGFSGVKIYGCLEIAEIK